ncbi:hypothetical protein [Kibdelosporangium philippinense]|uniref:hypothetical protein n=1 Tax=Kibdelosporangium philippinense TaxID=211113 RepID=UPI00361BE001
MSSGAVRRPRFLPDISQSPPKIRSTGKLAARGVSFTSTFRDGCLALRLGEYWGYD